MNELTVGQLENVLRKFDKDTVVHLSCGCCHHSSSGLGMLVVNDKTKQTYGYIELEVNAMSKPNPELNPNQLEYYKKEVESLNREIDEMDKIFEIYDNGLISINNIIDFTRERVDSVGR